MPRCISFNLAECTIERLVCTKDPQSGATVKERPRALLKGQAAVVELRVERAVCCEAFSQTPGLGRVAVRDGGRTLLVGVILEASDLE